MNTQEQRLDIIHNCEVLLNTVLKSQVQTDSTAAGRMISQLKWLKERAENQNLRLPVDSSKLASLRYISTNGDLRDLVDTSERYQKEVDIYLDRLFWLTNEGRLLLKPSFYPYVPRCIDALIRVLKTSPRPLAEHEHGSIDELLTIRQLFVDGKLVPPVGGMMPYRNLIRLENSIEDIPRGKDMIFLVQDLIFNGVRPDTWLTPADADRETAAL